MIWQYSEGDGIAVVGDQICVFLPQSDRQLGRALSETLSGAGLATIISTIGELTSRPMTDLPEFALVAWSGSQVTVLVRGSIPVRVGVEGGTHEFDGSGVATWRDQVVADAQWCAIGQVTIDGLDITAGTVRAAGLMSAASEELFVYPNAADEAAPDLLTPEAVVLSEEEREQRRVEEAPPAEPVETPPAEFLAKNSLAEPASDALSDALPAKFLSETPAEPSTEIPAELLAQVPPVEPLTETPAEFLLEPPAEPLTGAPAELLGQLLPAQPFVESTAAEAPAGPAEATIGSATLADAPEPETGIPHNLSVAEPPYADPAEGPSDETEDYLHDGRTISPEALETLRAQQSEQDSRPRVVLSRLCRTGHPNPPERTGCWVCDADVVGEAAGYERPALGTLRTSAGDTVPLDATYVIGRYPRAPRTTGEVPRILAVPSEKGEISATHLTLKVEDWHVLAVDESRNGTVLHRTGEEPRRLQPAVETVLRSQDQLDLGDGVWLVLEGLP